MLGQRIVTAVVLLALLVPALLAPVTWPFHVLMLLLLGAGAWEWARLNGLTGPVALAFAGLLALAGAAIGLSWPDSRLSSGAWVVVGVGWVVGGAWALRAGVHGWSQAPRAVRLLLGVGVLAAAWLALLQAHDLGVAYLLSAFMIVWLADIAAYFGGRTFGGPRLAPKISPGKTWSGALTGGAAVLAGAGAWMLWGPSADPAWVTVPYRLVDRWGAWGAAAALAGLAAMSVVGDLFESLVKRSAGVKDSSRLLPGHGGVLDRIDAVLPVLPLCLMCAS